MLSPAAEAAAKPAASGDRRGRELLHELPMRANKPERGSITPKTAEQATAVLTLDLVGLAEAAELAGIGRAAFSLRRSRHANFPSPVAEPSLRAGLVSLADPDLPGRGAAARPPRLVRAAHPTRLDSRRAHSVEQPDVVRRRPLVLVQPAK